MDRYGVLRYTFDKLDDFNDELKRIFSLPSEVYNQNRYQTIVYAIERRRAYEGIIPYTGRRMTTSYRCDICRQFVDNTGELAAHRYTHTLDSSFICIICCATFQSKAEIFTHICTHDDDQDDDVVYIPSIEANDMKKYSLGNA